MHLHVAQILRKMCVENGPPLSVGQQLHRLQQLQGNEWVLCVMSQIVHVYCIFSRACACARALHIRGWKIVPFPRMIRFTMWMSEMWKQCDKNMCQQAPKNNRYSWVVYVLSCASTVASATLSDIFPHLFFRLDSCVSITLLAHIVAHIVATCWHVVGTHCCTERWGAGVEYHFQEFNEPYAPS